MMDYDAWIRRAGRFTESLQGLPGKIDVTVRIAPPLTEDAANRLAGQLRWGLPEPMRGFLTRGSSSCCCEYRWTPPEELEGRVKEITESSRFLVGGACFCDPAVIEHFARCAYDIGEMLLTTPGNEREAELWRYATPFYSVGSGDQVALLMREYESANQLPVAYLYVEPGGYSHIIDTSFDDFLCHWEALAYVSGLHLGVFTDPVTKLVDPECHKAKLLRRLLSDALREK